MVLVIMEGEDRVDGVSDNGRRAVNIPLNILGPCPPCSPSSSLDRDNRKNGGHAQAHLHWLVAGHILSGHRHSSSVEVQANCALSQGILSHGALSLTRPFQAVVTISLTWTVVTIIFFLLSMQLHLPKLLVDNSFHGRSNFRLREVIV